MLGLALMVKKQLWGSDTFTTNQGCGSNRAEEPLRSSPPTPVVLKASVLYECPNEATSQNWILNLELGTFWCSLTKRKSARRALCWTWKYNGCTKQAFVKQLQVELAICSWTTIFTWKNYPQTRYSDLGIGHVFLQGKELTVFIINDIWTSKHFENFTSATLSLTVSLYSECVVVTDRPW